MPDLFFRLITLTGINLQYLDCKLSVNRSISFFIIISNSEGYIKWVPDNHQPAAFRGKPWTNFFRKCQENMSDEDPNLLHSPIKCFVSPLSSATGLRARADGKPWLSPEHREKRLPIWVCALSHFCPLLPPGESAPTFHAFVPLDWRLNWYSDLWPADPFKVLDVFYLTASHKGYTNTPTNSTKSANLPALSANWV